MSSRFEPSVSTLSAGCNNDSVAGHRDGMQRFDRSARFEALYLEHGNAVLRYARRRASSDIADDVTAETFAIAWRKLEKAPDEPLGWLLAIARRTLANQRRSDSRRIALIDRIRHQPAALSPDIGSDGALAAALRKLSDRDREVLLLVHWDDLSPSQAQAALGISAVAFRTRLHRARRRLAVELALADGVPAAGKGSPLHLITTKEKP